MKNSFALFAFNGDPMCFAHVLLNALDLDSKGYAVQLVIEGSAAKLVADFEKGDAQFTSKYQECLQKGLIAGICKACSAKMGTRQGLTLLDDMSGHPSIERYSKEGYSIVTF